MEAALIAMDAPLRKEGKREYARVLADSVRDGGEAPLEAAYEIGRRAMTEGKGVLEMVELHHDAMTALLREYRGWDDAPMLVEKAGRCFAESMAPFELAHRAIGDANNALRKLNDTLEDEVQRIALSLHDDAGQLMVAAHMRLDEAMRDMPPEAQERLSSVKAMLGLVEERIRDLSHELRPAMLDHLGLAPAIEFLASSFSQRTGLRIGVHSSLDGRLPPKLALVMYRIIQEALTNVRRHAQATRARIQIGLRGNWVHCQISDNGIGFIPAAAAGKPGLGLLGIRERLDAIGGKLRIQSAEGRGTKLKISVPLHQVEHADSNTSRRRPSSGA